jgi:hypothetical protein
MWKFKDIDYVLFQQVNFLLSPLGIRFAKEKQQVYFHVLSTFALNS